MGTLRFPLAILVVHAFLFPWFPEIRSPNELSRLYQARAIVDDHTLSVNGQMLRRGSVGDLSIRDGHYYPSKAPGVSFLGAPVYLAVEALRGRAERVSDRAGVFFLRLLVCMIPAAVAAEVLRRILSLRFEQALATAGATVFALGTTMWPYSTFLMGHGPTTAAIVLAWWAIERAQEAEGARPALSALLLVRNVRGAGFSGVSTSGAVDRTPRLWVLSGVAAGLAVLLEYTSLVALPLLGLYAATRSVKPLRAAALAFAGALPFFLALGAYHQAAFGGPFQTGYSHLVDQVFAELHARGTMGVGAPDARALAGSFLDPARGLLAWSPFLALGLPGLVLLARRDAGLAWFCAGALAVYGLFTSSFAYAWGWSVGPRHIVPLCAFLMPPALAAAAWLRDKGQGMVPAGLALFSLCVMALTMAVCPYLPDELTNPLHQLVVPLARAGLHVHDLLGMAVGVATPWTLLPWAAMLAAVALPAVAAFVPQGRPAQRASTLAGAVFLAMALFALHGLLGRPDRFDRTRAFMTRVYEPHPGLAPSVFDAP